MPITGKEISLYFHIPFCLKKCPYCHFYTIYYNEELANRFLNALIKDLKNNKDLLKEKTIKSIYFGGGTPFLLKAKNIEKILDELEKSDIEITLEANPDSIEKEEIKKFKSIGINRFSIGVQSFDDILLKKIGRTHTKDKAIKAILDVYDSGIKNISIDLMYDLPDQKVEDFEKNFHFLEKLPVSHVSLYNLVIEENSHFFKDKEKILKKMPNDTQSLKMLEIACNRLKDLGYERYEISAFSKDNKVSIHNLGYWQARDFLGFGPSAFSYFDKKRFQSVSNIKKYIDLIEKNSLPIAFEEKLSYPKDIIELLLINLRVLKGFNIKEFEKKNNKIPKEVLNYLKESEYILFENDSIKLSELGLLFYDSLASDII